LPKNRPSRRLNMSFGETMPKNLQLSVGFFGVLLFCSFSVGEEPKSRNGFWIPASTALQTETPAISTLPSLRTLSASESRDVVVERIVPLKTDDAASNYDIRPLVQEGDYLLSEGRWLDAKKSFEKALRRQPDNPTLRSKFTEARRRYEIEIRYQDATFSALTQKSSLEDQLAIFDEVFLDIDTYHVDRPQYSELFEFGVEGISEALHEDSFYRYNDIPIELKVQTEELFDSLKHTAKDWTLETEDDVRRSVLWLAKQMRRRIGISESTIISEFLCSAICSLDAYSGSLTPVQVEDIFSLIDGRFVGLGVELKTDQPTRIVRVIPNSPAQESGVNIGDELVQIDGRSTAKLSGAEIGELLQGLEGEKVALTLRSSNGRMRKITATRRPIEAPSVENAHVLDAPGNIGYVKISCFQKTTSEELLAALESLEAMNAQGLIIDLRQNPGGLLQEAINVSDVFLDSGTIVQTRGRNSSHTFVARKTKKECSLPLILIVDSGSASAAEIFAGAIQENGRGVIVGTPSYGKGTVQAIVQLTGKTQNAKPIAGLRLTTEEFYSPKGRAYGGVGVLPNVEVPYILDANSGVPVRAGAHQAYANQCADSSDNAFEVSLPTLELQVASPRNEVESDIFLRLAVLEANRQIAQNRERPLDYRNDR
jgi:carboxyl-terminal processing protease